MFFSVSLNKGKKNFRVNTSNISIYCLNPTDLAVKIGFKQAKTLVYEVDRLIQQFNNFWELCK